MPDRLLYAMGMRAALRLLAEDPRVARGAVPAAVLAEHRDGCDATIAALEGADAPGDQDALGESGS